MAVLTSPNPGGITTALIAALGLSTGKAIGDAMSPYEGQPVAASQFPYAVVYYVTPSLIAGSQDQLNPDAERFFTYQVTSVGQTRVQCDDMAAAVKACVLNRPNDQIGWITDLVSTDSRVIDRTFNNGSGTRRVDGGLFNCPDRYQLTVALL